MSPLFKLILLLPLLPLCAGALALGYFKLKHDRNVLTLLPALLLKVLAWGFFVALAYAVFMIGDTFINNNPQGPLMLLFISIPFAVGEFIGLIVWIRKAHAL